MIFPAPYLLASKIEAFRDRGKGDFLGSRDMEDIIAVLDGCADLKGQIQKAPADLKGYLKKEFAKFLSNVEFLESIHGHVRTEEEGISPVDRVIILVKEITG